MYQCLCIELTNYCALNQPTSCRLVQQPFRAFLLILLSYIEMVFPRRPTVICVEENEQREFLSFILPLSVLLLLGTVFIMYILYKTLVVCVYVVRIYVCGWMSVYCAPDLHMSMQTLYTCTCVRAYV